MKKTPMDDYRNAFNASAEDMNVADNRPTPAAAEGEGAPAVAVVIAEGAPEGGMPGDKEAPMTPQEVQQEKTWAGRLKKREEALKAREAELAAREAQMQGDPEMMANGGKVACKADGGKVKMMAEGGMTDPMADPKTDPMTGMEGNMTATADPAADPATDPAADPGMTTMDADMAGMAAADAAPAADPIEQLAADYGPEFVAAIDALVERRARAIVEEMGGAFASEIDGKITEIMKATNDGFGMMQQEILLSVADDIEDVLESEEFTAWVESLPEAEKTKAQQVIEAGTPSQGIKLIKQYKARAQGPSPEDVWAEDAAVAVKGKSPVRLPGRPAMSPDDEYRAAFNAA